MEGLQAQARLKYETEQKTHAANSLVAEERKKLDREKIKAALKNEEDATQLALDNLEGQRMGQGGYLNVAPVTSVSWVTLGDNRCFIGGSPDVISSVCSGTCDSGLCDVGGSDLCTSGPFLGSSCSDDLDCGFCDTGFRHQGTAGRSAGGSDCRGPFSAADPESTG